MSDALLPVDREDWAAYLRRKGAGQFVDGTERAKEKDEIVYFKLDPGWKPEIVYALLRYFKDADFGGLELAIDPRKDGPGFMRLQEDEAASH
jgi:hypothetical protein